MRMYIEFEFLCLTPLSAIFQLYHGDQFQWWRKSEYPERTTDPGQATGKLYHLRLRVKYTLFCNLQSWARTHAILVIAILGLYELLDPTTSLIEPPGPLECIQKLYIYKPEALKSLYRSPGYKKNQLVLCKNYVLQWQSS